MLNILRNNILLFCAVLTQATALAQNTAHRVTENRTLQPYTNTYNAHWEARRSPGGMILVVVPIHCVCLLLSRALLQGENGMLRL